LPKAFEDRECYVLFQVLDLFPGFVQNQFEKRHTVTCRYEKGFQENAGNVPTNRKKGNSLQKFLSIQKLLVLSD
jgi:hypothetical protein